MAGKYDFLNIRRGDTFKPYRFSFSGENSVPLVLTGCTARMQVRPSADSSTVLLSFSTAASTIETGLGTDANILELKQRLPADMSKVPAGNYVYDLEITWPDGTVETILEGKFVVISDVTK